MFHVFISFVFHNKSWNFIHDYYISIREATSHVFSLILFKVKDICRKVKVISQKVKDIGEKVKDIWLFINCN